MLKNNPLKLFMGPFLRVLILIMYGDTPVYAWIRADLFKIVH